MSSNRRTFLSLLGLGAVTAALPDHAEAASLRGDLKPVDGTWDLSWTARVHNARHRAVFDSPVVGNGVYRAGMWKNQYASVFGIKPEKLAAVLVIRHQGIAEAMDDGFWDEFEIAKAVAKEQKEPEPSGSAKGNPSRAELEKFIKEGGIVLACNVAFGRMAGRYRGKGLSNDDMRKRAMEHLIKGVILQPSGPFALMRAQDEGCNYMMGASL
jgi:hypothetical protein